MSHASPALDRARMRRTRARWTVAALFLAYIPVMLGLTRWLPSLATAGWYAWALAMMIAWFLSLNIDWPRRNFQVREPDRRDRRSTRP
jgi:ABC-type multidrug transport system permease subunit